MRLRGLIFLLAIVISLDSTCGAGPPLKRRFINPGSPDWTSEIHQDPATVSKEPLPDANAPRLLTTLSGPSDGFVGSAFLEPGHRVILLVKQTNIVKIWDFFSGRETLVLGADRGVANCVDVKHDNSLVAVGMHNSIELWDLKTRQRRAVLKAPDVKRVDGIAFSVDGNLLAAEGTDQEIKIWDVQAAKIKFSLKGGGRNCVDLAFNHDGSVLASAFFNGLVVLWDPKTGLERQRFEMNGGSLYSLAFIGETQLLALGDSTGALTIVDTEAMEEVGSVQAHEGIVFSIALAAGGKIIATGGDDQLVRLWKVDGLRELAVLRGHEESIVQVRFSQNDKYMLAKGGSDRHAIQVWQVPIDRILHEINQVPQ